MRLQRRRLISSGACSCVQIGERSTVARAKRENYQVPILSDTYLTEADGLYIELCRMYNCAKPRMFSTTGEERSQTSLESGTSLAALFLG